MTFKNLGPLKKEVRTPAVCEICNNYIYKQTYQDDNSENQEKVIFVCKNCLKNNNNK